MTLNQKKVLESQRILFKILFLFKLFIKIIQIPKTLRMNIISINSIISY